MMMKKPVLLLVALALGACSEFELTGGYRAFEADQGMAIVDERSKFRVDPHVVAMNVSGPFVSGLREAPRYDASRFSPEYGFFILDTGSGSLHEGMDAEAFEAALADRGIERKRLLSGLRFRLTNLFRR